MNIEDLEAVNVLNEKLKFATLHHKQLMALTSKSAHWNSSRVTFKIGGDIYGNNTLHTESMNILDSRDAVAICRKLQSKAWGVVVGIRAELRSLGVNLDEVINEPSSK